MSSIQKGGGGGLSGLHIRSRFWPVEMSGRGRRSGAAFALLFQGNPRHALVTVSRSNSVCVALLFGASVSSCGLAATAFFTGGLARPGSGSGASWQQRLRSLNVGQAGGALLGETAAWVT